MNTLRAWLADALLGPPCPLCWYRARGPRSLAAHIARHAIPVRS